MWFSSKRNSKPTLPTPKEGDSTASDASSEEARYSRERRRSASFADPWAGVDVRDEMPPAFLEKLDALYPGALNHEEAAVAIKAILRKQGFTAHSAIALDCADAEAHTSREGWCGRLLSRRWRRVGWLRKPCVFDLGRGLLRREERRHRRHGWARHA